jgi:hypothetical protein
MRRALPLSGILIAGLLGCGAEAPAPDKPTWVDDVEPILRANCFHCHGANVNQKFTDNYTAARWDIYDITDPAYAQLGFMMQNDSADKNVSFAGAKQIGLALYVYANTAAQTEQTRMPPPPATPLSLRDQTVLENWAMAGKLAQGQHTPNHKPTIGWLVKGKTYEVLDEDQDQVLGKLTCGGTDYPIDRSGTHTLPGDATLPCSASLYDGFEPATGNLR